MKSRHIAFGIVIDKYAKAIAWVQAFFVFPLSLQL